MFVRRYLSWMAAGVVLLCAGAALAQIQVQSATYGELVHEKHADKDYCKKLAKGQSTDKKAHVARACDDRWECTYTIDRGNKALGNPKPHCPKGYVVTWRCPPLEAPETLTVQPEAHGSKVTLKCAREAARVPVKPGFAPQVPGRPRVDVPVRPRVPTPPSRPVYISRPAKRLGGLLGHVTAKKKPTVTLPQLKQKYAGKREAGFLLGELVSIDRIIKAYEQAMAKGEAPAGEKAPTALVPKDWKCPEEKPKCKNPHEQYEELLPDIDEYIEYIWANVVARFGRAGLGTKEDAANVLFNYGCRQIARHMPGYARIVEVRIPPSGGGLAGNWDEGMGSDERKDALGKSTGKRKDPKGDPNKYKGPPPKEEVIEVCNVTHAQIEATLKKDLAILAGPRIGRGGAARVDAPVVAPGASRETLQKIEGKLSVDLRPESAKVADSLLERDLGKIEGAPEHLLGQTFGVIAGRLVGFYRKGGKAATFEYAMKDAKVHIKIPVTGGALKGEVDHQNKFAGKNAEREYLRRRVDQWTDAWEYMQLTGYIETGPRVSKTGVPAQYRRAETAEVGRFWHDCEEIWDICQDPKLEVERSACVKCAYKAVLNHCLDGKVKDDTHCGEWASAEYPDLSEGDKGGTHEWPHEPRATGQVYVVTTDEGPFKGKRIELPFRKGNTFLSWVASRIVEDAYNTGLHWGDAARGGERLNKSAVKSVTLRRFLPIGSSDAAKILNNSGKRYLDQLPISAWQKCYLWTGSGSQTCDIIYMDKPNDKGKLQAVVTQWEAGGERRRDTPLFRLVLADPAVNAKLAEIAGKWDQACGKGKQRPKIHGKHPGDCGKWDHETKKHWENLRKKGFKQLADGFGFTEDTKMGKVGGRVGGAIVPIIGKILGMLMKAAGIEEMMKMLTKAAGLTPEQSIDCEDVEYRHDVMKLSGKLDNKQSCLTKVFAKNFVNVLESIIIMLGNKLVDWAVDLLNTALKAVKSALISAAGSVPFAGGVLAAAVDIAWDLLFNFGVRALLKGLVVSQLPKWLKIKELATGDFFELMKKHPIISVVAGIILQLLEAAVTYGDKGLLEVGFQTVLNAIQAGLEAACKRGCDFWLRALTFAKKDLLQKSRKDMKVDEQIRQLLSSMIEGFKLTISGRLAGNAKEEFDSAVLEIQDMVMKISWTQITAKITKDPVGFIVGDLLAKKLLPAVLPIVTTFVDMPEVAKKVLNELAASISWAVRTLRKGGASAGDVAGRIGNVFKELGSGFLAQIPGADSVKKLIQDAYDGLVWAIQNLQRLKTEYLDKPWESVKKLAGLLKNFVVAQVGELVSDARLGLEKSLVGSAVAKLFDFLTDDRKRGELFGDRGPDVKAILKQAVDVAKPYLVDRLKDAAKGTGIDGTVGRAVEALMSGDGPFAKGEEFVRNVPRWLEEKGGAILGEIAEGATSLLTAKATEMGAGPAIVAIAKGAVGAIRDALKAPGGLKGLAEKGGAEIVKLAKKGMEELVKAVENVVSGGNPSAPIAGHVRSVLGGLAGLFDNPGDLVAKGKEAWKAFVERVKGNFREIVKWTMERVLPASEVEALLSKVTLDEKSIAAILTQLVERTAGGSSVMPVLREIIEGVVRVAANPSELGSMLREGAPAAWRKIKATAASLLQKVVDSVVRDTGLRKIADEATRILTTVFDGGSGTGGPQIGAIVKDALGKVIPVAMSFLRDKVTELFPSGLAALKDLVREGLDWVGSFAVDVVTKPDAWSRLTSGGGGGVLKGIVDKVLGVVKAQIARLSAPGAVNSFIAGLVDAVGGFLKNAGEVVKAFKNKTDSVKTLLKQIAPAVKGFLNDLFVNRVSGIARTVVKFLVDGLAQLLENPGELLAFIDKATKADATNYKKMVKDLAASLLKQLVGFLKAKAKTLAQVLEAAVDYVSKHDAFWAK